MDGNQVSSQKSLISVEGTLNIQDGTVLENSQLEELVDYQAGGGAIYIRTPGVVNMTGGVIRNNKIQWRI